MTADKATDTSRKTRGTRKAAAAKNVARIREKLELSDKAKREREARERDRRETLRRSLQMAEAQARKVDRDEWRRREAHLAAVVGRLALTELAAAGSTDLRLDATLLHRLVDADLQSLKEWLAHMLADADADADAVDIALPGDDSTPPAGDGS